MLELFADNLDLVHKVIKSHRLRQNKSIMIFIIWGHNSTSKFLIAGINLFKYNFV